jgi:hypothetical protein
VYCLLDKNMHIYLYVKTFLNLKLSQSEDS